MVRKSRQVSLARKRIRQKTQRKPCPDVPSSGMHVSMCPAPRSLGLGACNPNTRRKPGGLQTVSVASAYFVFVRFITYKLYCDRTPGGVRICLGIIGERIQMREIVPDGSERALLIFPALGKISFASRSRSHALKDGGRNRLQLRFLSADHIDRNSHGLSEFSNVLGRHYAGVIGTIREHDDHSSAGVLRSISYRQQESVVKSRRISSHCGANPAQNLHTVGG